VTNDYVNKIEYLIWQWTQGWKNLGFFGFFYSFLGFLGFNVRNAEHRYMTHDK